ncbi:5'-methylthioadenosine/S-adenosylhomocysteine nucleosidase family protein [Aurantibacillus circumpalustris]|uniref:5'-methylthioadenosine/S-adenosylhomocysteine nucleosidase family protein n=1 Tax=Aurantibacillus circumpalustris TaxID=3036359 RepID=UPI00295B102D|nr:hypothetical protein [Aurantibacillus circumpalustris]
MKKTLSYSCVPQLIPPSPKGENRTKFCFRFKSHGYNLKGCVIQIEFDIKSKIEPSETYYFPTISNIKYVKNKFTFTLEEVGDQVLTLQILVLNSNNFEGVTVSSLTEGFEISQSQNIETQHKKIEPLSTKYHILLASALQSEIEPILKSKKIKWDYLDEQKIIKTASVKDSIGNVYNVLVFSKNQMGMPITGVALTQVIEKYKPKYVLFVGTCAGLKKDKNLNKGDVLIPEYIYCHDSGRHGKSGFKFEHRHYDVGPSLHQMANDMILNSKYNFNINTDCGFCSGASVISNAQMRDQIIKAAGRKVLGLDMEAYVIAIINQLYTDVETIVIKGIMDFGVRKNDEFKKLAISNAIKVSFDLMNYIIRKETKV